jgi:hypothetical protein
MTDFTHLVSSLREQMTANLSRSDVLKPLAWLVGILATSTIAAVFGKAPSWLLVLQAVFLGGTIFLYAAAYCYCLLRDRDALRSERYSLNKMAIEHGYFGDDRTGLVDMGARATSEAGAPKITTGPGQ